MTDVTQQVRERNQPTTTGPTPDAKLPTMPPDPERLEKLLASPDAGTAVLGPELERLKATVAAVEKRHAVKAREEQAQREQDERHRREQAALDAQTEKALTAIVATMRTLLPGSEMLAATVEDIERKYLARSAALGQGRGATSHRLYGHPVYRLKPLLDMLRRDPAPERAGE